MMSILLLWFGAILMILLIWIRLQRLLKLQSRYARGRVSTVTGDSKWLVLGLSRQNNASSCSCLNDGCSHSAQPQTSSARTRVEYYEYLEP